MKSNPRHWLSIQKSAACIRIVRSISRQYYELIAFRKSESSTKCQQTSSGKGEENSREMNDWCGEIVEIKCD